MKKLITAFLTVLMLGIPVNALSAPAGNSFIDVNTSVCYEMLGKIAHENSGYMSDRVRYMCFSDKYSVGQVYINTPMYGDREENYYSYISDNETGGKLRFSAIQCKGYAKYCYYKLYGDVASDILDGGYANNPNVKKLPFSSMTVSGLRSFAKGLKTGTQMRMMGTGDSHSMVFLTMDTAETGMFVLHANWSNTYNLIRLNFISFPDFIALKTRWKYTWLYTEPTPDYVYSTGTKLVTGDLTYKIALPLTSTSKLAKTDGLNLTFSEVTTDGVSTVTNKSGYITKRFVWGKTYYMNMPLYIAMNYSGKLSNEYTDLNGDNIGNALDLIYLQRNIMFPTLLTDRYDFNGDGRVNVNDTKILQARLLK